MAHCLICNSPTDRRRFGGRFFYCPDCDFHFADRSALPAPEAGTGYGADYYKRGSSPLDWMFRVFTVLEQKRILSAVKGCRRVLDIGCGSGWMAQRLQHQSAEAYGVDTSEAAIALAAGKVDASRLRCGTLASANFETGFFDAAVAVHVLEHIEDPVAFATEARRILKEDGILLLRIPNLASLEARLAGENWYHFDYPFHVAHYSPRAVTRLLQTSGFRDVRISFAVTEYRQTLLYSMLSALGVPLPFWMKLTLLPLQVVFMPLSWLLALSGNSGTIEVVARK
ncbi:MAG: class I SAM-dependent methyltransferase [Verrucomicrobia bacterium]|nr:class I SAM-dependent methyltransferase [Verrucomicrobiota bacterium]